MIYLVTATATILVVITYFGYVFFKNLSSNKLSNAKAKKDAYNDVQKGVGVFLRHPENNYYCSKYIHSYRKFRKQKNNTLHSYI